MSRIFAFSLVAVAVVLAGCEASQPKVGSDQARTAATGSAVSADTAAAAGGATGAGHSTVDAADAGSAQQTRTVIEEILDFAGISPGL